MCSPPRRPRTSSIDTPELAALRDRRAVVCRLSPDRALQSLAGAEAFLNERGMLTLTPDCALPSLFGACHEQPYQPGGHGFAAWPRTKYVWHFELAARPEVYALRLHRGKTLYCSAQTLVLVDPLCREELARADAGDFGPVAAQLTGYLAAAGPAQLDDIKRELGLETAALRRVRQRLESVGALVSRTVAAPAVHGTQRETSELARWDQRVPASLAGQSTPSADALDALVVAGVHAAVVAPRAELASWFSWPLAASRLTALLAHGDLTEPQEGWIATGA